MEVKRLVGPFGQGTSAPESSAHSAIQFPGLAAVIFSTTGFGQVRSL